MSTQSSEDFSPRIATHEFSVIRASSDHGSPRTPATLIETATTTFCLLLLLPSLTRTNIRIASLEFCLLATRLQLIWYCFIFSLLGCGWYFKKMIIISLKSNSVLYWLFIFFSQHSLEENLSYELVKKNMRDVISEWCFALLVADI